MNVSDGLNKQAQGVVGGIQSLRIRGPGWSGNGNRGHMFNSECSSRGCPTGTILGAPESSSMQIGSVISAVATPVSGVLGMDCYDPVTQDLRPTSMCAQTRDRLNSAKTFAEFASAVLDRIRNKQQTGEQNNASVSN